MIIAVMKVRTWTGFEPVTSRYRYDALTNWAMKPLTLGAGHKGVAKGGSWGARDPPFCKPFLTKQPTTGGENAMMIPSP